MKLGAGVTVSYFDDGPNGGTEIGIAVVIRARGLGVLLKSNNGTLFRIPRSDVVRVIPQEKQMATLMTAKPAAAPNHTRGMVVPPQIPVRERTEEDLAAASEAYHAHPSHPPTCERYQEHYGRRCPCENYQGAQEQKS